MSTAINSTSGDEIMTDFQFKSLIQMVLMIVKEAEDKDKAIQQLEKLIPESNKE